MSVRGNALTITVEHDSVTEVFTGFGEKGVSAETVAKGAVDRARGYWPLTQPWARISPTSYCYPWRWRVGANSRRFQLPSISPLTSQSSARFSAATQRRCPAMGLFMPAFDSVPIQRPQY